MAWQMPESGGFHELWHWSGRSRVGNCWHEAQESAGLHLAALCQGPGFSTGGMEDSGSTVGIQDLGQWDGDEL